MWWTEFEDSKTVDFLVEDDSGTIRIGQENPEYDWPPAIKVGQGWHRHAELREFCLVQGLSRNVTAAIWGNRRRRFREAVIRPGDKVLVLGTAKVDPSDSPEGQNLYVGRGKQESLFCISAHTERDLVGKLQFRFLLGLSGGVVAVACGVAWFATILI